MEKERYLSQLLDIIQVLKGPELDLARKHLKAYESNHTVKRRKMFQLYKYIKINDIQNYGKLKKRVSPDSTDDSFNKLIRRTTERIQESLIVDVNISRKNSYPDLFKTKFHLNKMLSQAQIIAGRGLILRSESIFINIIRRAKKFELYNELLEALYFKQTLSYSMHGMKGHEDSKEEIAFYENCRRLLNNSKAIQRELEYTLDRKSNKGEIDKSIKDKLSLLYLNYEATKSSNILSYYYIMKLEVENIENKYFQVDNTIDKFIKLIKESPSLYSKNRISIMYKLLSESKLKQLDFGNALTAINDSSKWIGVEGLIYIDLNVKKIQIYILTGLYVEAIDKLNLLKFTKHLGTLKFENSIVLYFESIAYFGLNKFKEAQTILLQKNEIEKDKEGWNVWIRIMRLLCSIEMLKLNMIDYEMESFRKYLERTGKQYEVRERDKLVLKVLLELDKNNYNFSITAIVVANELDKLKSTNKKYAWNPDSPELILFHDWFEAKLLKKEYEPNFEVYREAMRGEE
jgi:hypothetical protein